VVQETVAKEVPVVAGPGELGDILKQARTLEQAGDLVGARAGYLALLKKSRGTRYKADAERVLGRINIELAMTPMPMPEKEHYVVKRGDSVERIARRFGTTVGLIQKGNRLANPNLIKAGDSLRILKGKFSMSISKSRNDLVVLLNGEFFKRYRVGTGKFDKTPVGTFEISDKITEPVWWRPDGKEVPFGDPANILGTRWMALRATGDTPDVRGYGIHGTWEPDTIGKSESAGCVRMLNADVEEIFTLVPLHTEVTITS
jgi:lipoprotein-anchoring transpeptidase ErfK/SrfK